MDIKANDGGGTSVYLVEGEDLDEVPITHRALLTPAIREAFVNPRAYFQRIANTCPFAPMASWFKLMVDEGVWELELHVGEPKHWTSSGYFWIVEDVRGATIAPATGTVLQGLPKELQQYYSMVGSVNWMEFGYAGGLEGQGQRA